MNFHLGPCCAAFFCVIASPLACSQEFPNRPIRFVVPFAPGGPADVSARTLSIKLAETLRQNIVIDNRPGGGGIIAAEIDHMLPGRYYQAARVQSCLPVTSGVFTASGI